MAQASRVVADFCRETAGPQCDRTRHGLLHVRVAGQGDRTLRVSEAVECSGDSARIVSQRLDGIPQVQAQRCEHLVVARPARVQSRAGLADPPREQCFERGLAILQLERNRPLATGMAIRNVLQSVANHDEVGLREQAALVQHFGVRDRSAHVVGHEAVVERVVFAGREAQHALIQWRALVPESCHGMDLLLMSALAANDAGQFAPCSAGVSALVSATTSVPVPSFVKISASSASVEA